MKGTLSSSGGLVEGEKKKGGLLSAARSAAVRGWIYATTEIKGNPGGMTREIEEKNTPGRWVYALRKS